MAAYCISDDGHHIALREEGRTAVKQKQLFQPVGMQGFLAMPFRQVQPTAWQVETRTHRWLSYTCRAIVFMHHPCTATHLTSCPVSRSRPLQMRHPPPQVWRCARHCKLRSVPLVPAIPCQGTRSSVSEIWAAAARFSHAHMPDLLRGCISMRTP